MSVPYEITPRPLTLRGKDYIGLAEDGVAPDTSLRDVQVAPEYVDGMPVGAVANNYVIGYEMGDLAEEFGILNAPVDAGGTAVAYLGQSFRLLSAGSPEKSEQWSSSDAAVAAIDPHSGLVTAVGAGSCEITLRCGEETAALTLTVLPREIQAADQHLMTTYDGTKDAGTYVTFARLEDPATCSEPYGVRHTVLPQVVTYTPAAETVSYGSTLEALDFAPGKAVCAAQENSWLEPGTYPIYAAAAEDLNHRVRIADAAVTVLPKALTITGGFLEGSAGATLRKPNGPATAPAAVDPNAAFVRMGYRLYGEANLVSDYAIQGLAAGDNAAQIIDLLAGSLCCEQYVSSPVGEPEPKDTQYLGVSGNYTVYFAQGVQIIARRPVSLETRNDIDLELFRLDILQDGALAPDAVKTIEAMLTNNLSDRHTDGLSSILGDTVADLGIYVRSAVLSADQSRIDVSLALQNDNYTLMAGAVAAVSVVSEKIAIEYGTLGRGSSSITVYQVDAGGQRLSPTDVIGDDIRYLIYRYDPADGGQGYAYYKELTPVREVQMVKGQGAGVYIADYSSQPLTAGKYVMFALAMRYTIIE